MRIASVVLALVLALGPVPAAAVNGFFTNPNCTVSLTHPKLAETAGSSLYFCADSTTPTLAVVVFTKGTSFAITRYGDTANPPAAAPAGSVRIWALLQNAGTVVVATTGLAQLQGFDAEAGAYVTQMNGGVAGSQMYDIVSSAVLVELAVVPGAGEQLVLEFLREGLPE